MAKRDVSNEPVIIEVAVNGATPVERNPNVPRSAKELADTSIACIEAGAAIIHTHIADISVDAKKAAALYLEHFRPVLARFPEALIYPTIVFGVPVEERVAHTAILAEEGVLKLGICDPGSLNLAPTGDDGLPLPSEFVYTNSPYDIQHKFGICERYKLGPGMAIFEPGFLRYVLAYHRAGRLPQGALIRLYLGGESSYRGAGYTDLLFGLPATPRGLDAYLDMLEGCELPWSVSVLSGDVLANGVARHALEQGGHIRVGLEDFAGPRQPSNLELVQELTALIGEVGRPIATSAETAKILRLPR